MTGDFFARRFGKNAKDFSTVTEVISFVERKAGRCLPVKIVHPDTVSSRDSVFKFSKQSAGESFDKRIRKR